MRSPSDELLAKLADQLGIDVDELFLSARRLPSAVVEELAADPAAGAKFLRSWPGTRQGGGR